MSSSKIVALAALLAASTSLAQTVVPTINCKDATDGRPNVIYVAGSSAIRPFLGFVASLVRADGYSIVYQSQGSCTGVAAILDPDPAKHLMKDAPAVTGKAANYAMTFLPDGSARECFLSATGDVVDVGASDVYAATCGYTPPAGVSDYEGPIQPMTLIVSSVSTQTSISAEAAYLAFGLGGNSGQSAPWTDSSYFFVRNASSGTQQMVARAINVPADKWWGTDRGGSGAVRTGMKTLLDAAGAEKGLGIISIDIADDERANLRVLAFKPYGGTCAYLPDSSATSFDKKNVRDGHYPIWGPVHFLTNTTGGVPGAAAAALVTRFAAPKLDVSLLDAINAKHLVPKCAMQVKRTGELGPFQVRGASDYHCDCYFEKAVNGSTSCTACTTASDCPGARPACNYGYCEVH
jgi:ABC-type phosphate transport system substrate-binding protein